MNAEVRARAAASGVEAAAILEVRHARKRFAAPEGGHVVALDDLSLAVAPREFLTLLGPSGCGKSTLLNMIAGLEPVTAGDILIDGRVVNDFAPKDRDIAMVFQSYALYPSMNVYDNMSFGMKVRGVPRAVRDTEVGRVAALLQLDMLLERRPSQLSGGQRQRVAIGRAIVREPKAFLFDEPLSNLDAALRLGMRLEITELHQRLKTTMIYVTHDQVEAMTMADKIVVLNAGRIEQAGSPLELYKNPRNIFVAGFIGSPKMNFIGGQVAKHHNAATVGIRPEHITLSTVPNGAWKGTVGVAEHLGSDTFVYVHTQEAGTITARISGEKTVRHGDTVWLTPLPDKIYRFDSEGLAI